MASPNSSVAKKSLGRIGVLLLPSVKMKTLSPRGKTYDRELHNFLVAHFGGYTIASGNITGYWKRDDGSEECNEHRQYKMAFTNEESFPALEEFISRLAAELGEESIFWEVDGTAWLLFPKQKKKMRKKADRQRAK